MSRPGFRKHLGIVKAALRDPLSLETAIQIGRRSPADHEIQPTGASAGILLDGTFRKSRFLKANMCVKTNTRLAYTAS